MKGVFYCPNYSIAPGRHIVTVPTSELFTQRETGSMLFGARPYGLVILDSDVGQHNSTSAVQLHAAAHRLQSRVVDAIGGPAFPLYRPCNNIFLLPTELPRNTTSRNSQRRN